MAMSISSRVIVWLVVMVVLKVEGFHAVHQELVLVSIEVVDKKYKTQFHYQSPRNWINGKSSLILTNHH